MDSGVQRNARVCHLPQGRCDDPSHHEEDNILWFVGERVCKKELFVLPMIELGN